MSRVEELKLRRRRYRARAVLILGIIMAIIISFGMSLYSIHKISYIQDQMDDMYEKIADSNEANQKVLAILQEARDNKELQSDGTNISIRNPKQVQKQTVLKLKANGISQTTDLGSNRDISVEDMDKIINYYSNKIKGGSRFKGKGYAFVEASKRSGLNPIYIFAHASVESGFGNSYLARTRNNYFGIAAYDSNPDASYRMGNTIDEGLINGAVWIKKNYYDDGNTTLSEMKETYASDPKWARNIEYIMNESISIL